jgi:hypothetical protein
MTYGTMNYKDCQRQPIQGMDGLQKLCLLIAAGLCVGTLLMVWGTF